MTHAPLSESDRIPDLPKQVVDWTPEQREEAVKYIATLSLAKIRKRQRIIAAQMEMRPAKENHKIFRDLQEMYDIASDAVWLREFGLYKGLTQ